MLFKETGKIRLFAEAELIGNFLDGPYIMKQFLPGLYEQQMTKQPADSSTHTLPQNLIDPLAVRPT